MILNDLENYTVHGDSKPTMPSADEELTALPVNTDCVEHELHDDLDVDLDLELAAAVHDDDNNDDDDGQTRPDHIAVGDTV